jgi:cell division protein FtsW
MFFLAGADLQQLTIALSITGGLLGLSASQIEYVANRLANFITPQTNVINYQAQQAITVFYSGGLWGQGPVSTMRDPVHVPAAHTDTIFAIIGHDFGIIGALIVVMLFIALAYRGVRIAQHAPDPFGMLLAVGVTCWLTIQAFTHIAVVLELVPTTGVNLPFISYGGSSMLVTMAGIGLLLSVSRSTSEETAAASTRAQQRTTRKSNGRQATSYAYGWRYRRPRLSGNRHR